MSALAEALVAAQAELPCALGKDADRMNAEIHEARMDAFCDLCERIRVTDLYDSVQDARSESRYTDDPSAEPEQAPFDPGEPVFVCIVDESAGFRG